MADGLQIRAPEPETEPDTAAAEPEQGSSGASRHWRASKLAVLETYVSAVSEADPDPHVPRCFIDLVRTVRMIRGLGHALPAGLGGRAGRKPPPGETWGSARPPARPAAAPLGPPRS